MRAPDNYHLAMEKEKTKIHVQDVITGQTLMEYPLDESEKAYVFAAEMEIMGLDVKVVDPTLSETLTESLGFSDEVKAEYMRGLDEEIEAHEGSCCSKKVF